MSSTEIAAEIGGCTRNAVIGLAYRAHVALASPRPKVEKKQASARPKSSKTGSMKRVVKPTKTSPPVPLKKKQEPAFVDAEPIYEFPDSHYEVHLEEVKSGQCRRPLWNDDKRPGLEAYFYCGKPVKAGSSYCWHCHKKMYDGLPVPRERKRSSARLSWRGEFA
ncbi:GcrA family cell cycle regulator [Mesorhizobium sp. M1B.F.Ca.ET.045.04.1.1]|uniref:GcrA family cell cycle regulator n=1 Tax=Mesorhizobium sp. M1B.F.Ca.ET.045.04.1.1 TaxID=2493673 RepID=UPI001FE1A6F2|nr:GcrA family cell cycle regulator [Mesorhizobium sp. M1B.F.Ca.ET.045.04.1.1]